MGNAHVCGTRRRERGHEPGRLPNACSRGRKERLATWHGGVLESSDCYTPDQNLAVAHPEATVASSFSTAYARSGAVSIQAFAGKGLALQVWERGEEESRVSCP